MCSAVAAEKLSTHETTYLGTSQTNKFAVIFPKAAIYFTAEHRYRKKSPPKTIIFFHIYHKLCRSFFAHISRFFLHSFRSDRMNRTENLQRKRMEGRNEKGFPKLFALIIWIELKLLKHSLQKVKSTQHIVMWGFRKRGRFGSCVQEFPRKKEAGKVSSGRRMAR